MSDVPLTLPYAPVSPLPPSRWSRCWAVPLACLLAAWSIGFVTNGVSGVVSRDYFNDVVGAWYGHPMSWADVVEQGMIESSGFGVLFAIAVTLTYVLATRARLHLLPVTMALAAGSAIALAGWCLGGLIGAGWAYGWPSSFLSTFPNYEETRLGLSRWAFVGGSIWGVYLGGLLAVFAACAIIVRRWQRIKRAARWPA